LQEDLYQDFEANMAKLMQFLEIDITRPLKPVVSNESAVPRNPDIYHLYKEFKRTKIKNMLKPFFPYRFRKWLRKDALLKHFNYPPMENEVKVELYVRYADEIKQLESIINRDLSHWKNEQQGTLPANEYMA
jgi:hypothetical protein